MTNLQSKLINGLAYSQEIQQSLKTQIDSRLKQGIAKPGLATILVGNDEASEIYVRSKRKKAEDVGIKSFHYHLPITTTEAELIGLINEINNNPEINGVLVQLPLPLSMNTLRVNSAIDPRKDVDGFTPTNMGKLALGEPELVPCTPLGIIELIKRYNITIKGANVVVVGSSNIVGKPLAHLLLINKATVTLCHKHTKDLPSITKTADILISATGAAHLIDERHVKDGAVAIDVGVNRQSDGKLVGDINMEKVIEKVSAITPVPGGVGPMTIAMLLHNTLQAQNLQLGIKD